MHILFLTTANLSSNPRLVKELRIALSLNYEVTVLLFDLKQWTSGLEEKYHKEFDQVKFIYLPVTKTNNFYSWLQSTTLNFLAKKVYKFFKSSILISAFASDKWSFLLSQELKKLNNYKVNLVIAHNLGALCPGYQFSKRHLIPFGFDVEDFHPGETIHKDKENEISRRSFLMQQLLPQASYVTSASPLIAEEIEKLCNVSVTTINNSFYNSEFSLPSEDYEDSKVKFVWFSQNINHGRGLELILPALDKFRDNVSLTLIGNLNHKFADTYLMDREYVKIIAPLLQHELHKELSKYDIGLGLELRNADFNRDIALTNKIFAYKQAGLFILATDTKAQSDFMSKYKEEGYVCKQTIEALITGVASIIDNISTIRAGKENRFYKAKEIAFETEAQKLVTLWERSLQK